MLPPLLLAALLAAPASAQDDGSFRIPPGMTFHRRPVLVPPEPPTPPIDGGIDARDGEELHCGHIRRYVARATPDQMSCIRSAVRAFIDAGGNVHFPEDTCDARAVALLGRLRDACGYTGGYLMLWNREDIGRQDGLEPGVRGAIGESVQWGVHFVAAAVDQDGLCWTLDPALGRDQGGVIPFREHLAMTDYRGRASLVQASRWSGRPLSEGGQYALCMADCLGNLNRRLVDLRDADDPLERDLWRVSALGTCQSCTQDCGRRFTPTLFKYTCDQVFRRSRGSSAPSSAPKPKD